MPDYLPAEVLARPDFQDACARHDFGAMFLIIHEYRDQGWTLSHISRRCEMTPSNLRSYTHIGRQPDSISVIERVSDGLHIPSDMLRIGSRPWEPGSASTPPRRIPNLILRRIREEERNETRREFAQALGKKARELGETVSPSERYVARLEDGDVRTPHPAYRRVLAALCSKPISELGFQHPEVSSPSYDGSFTFSRARKIAGFTQESLAAKLGVERSTVIRWEKGETEPHPHMRPKLCRTLGISGQELDELLRPDEISVQFRSDNGSTEAVMIEEDQEEVERRRLLQSLAVLGVSASPLSQALENVRTALGKTVGYDERNNLDYWEEATVEYGYSYLYASPGDLIPDLASDILAVRSIIHKITDKDSIEYRSWCRVGGALSALMAKSLSNLDRSRNSREWWGIAHHLADASGDKNLALLVRGEHIIHGLYENRPIPVLLRQANSAAEIANNHPCIGLLDLTGARAQVSALAGDYHSAEEYLHGAREILEQIPSPPVTNGTGLVMLWGEAELRYTEAWVYSYMGEETKMDRAASRAFSLYPASDKRSPVQIKLMQAFTRVRCGDITEGIQHAQAVYEPLAFGRTTMVDALARDVLDAIPAEAWKHSDVAEYRELVASRIPERRAIEA